MMGSMVRRVLVIALVGTSLVVAACGSDDDSPESAEHRNGTTGSTGPTGGIPPIVQLPGSSEERGSGSNGSSSGSDGTSAGDGSSGKERSRQEQRRRRAPGTSTGPAAGGYASGAGGSAPTVQSDDDVYRLAKEICANVTLEGIAVNLRISLDQRDDRFVARAFSRSLSARQPRCRVQRLPRRLSQPGRALTGAPDASRGAQRFRQVAASTNGR